MKKNVLITAAMIAALTVTGCSGGAGNTATTAGTSASSASSAATAGTTQSETASVGAYEVNTDLTAVELPDDAQKAFDKAAPGTTEGDKYVPIALFGRQVVSGTNYAILCYLHDEFASGDERDTLQVVTIYEDLDGNAQVLSTVPFNLSDVAGEDNTISTDENASGAFTVNEEANALPIPDEVEKGIDTLKSSGDVRSVAVLGSQVVAGTNYAVLCMMHPDGVSNPHWAVVTVYVDTDGKAEVTNTYDIDPGAYTEYGSTDSAGEGNT